MDYQFDAVVIGAGVVGLAESVTLTRSDDRRVRVGRDNGILDPLGAIQGMHRNPMVKGKVEAVGRKSCAFAGRQKAEVQPGLGDVLDTLRGIGLGNEIRRAGVRMAVLGASVLTAMLWGRSSAARPWVIR